MNAASIAVPARQTRASATGGGFGALIRWRRLAAGLSQEQLAERAGLSAHGISDLERGARTTPQRATVRLLAQAPSLGPAETAALLAACPEVRILATSREALAIQGETCVPVPPLALPPPDGNGSGRGGGGQLDLDAYPATRLFAERAARLLGAAATVSRVVGIVRCAPWQADYTRDVALVRAVLTPQAFAAAWEGGERLDREAQGAMLLETLNFLVRQAAVSTPAA